MDTSKKLILSAAIAFFSFGNSQSIVEGNLNIESHKFAKAKEVFQKLVDGKPSEENYFYLGNAYLSQFSPDFVKAKENFEKGLALDKKSYLCLVGLASVEMGKGNKEIAIAQFNEIAAKVKDKNPEVLFRIGEALTQYETQKNVDLGIQFLQKAVDAAQKKGEVPSEYYNQLGDAYLLKRDAGSAMNAFDRSAEVAKSKAPILTRIGTLWFQAQKYEKAQDNLLEAIKIDPTYAPAYKAFGDLNSKFQQNANAAANYKKYITLADKDPNTILEYAKLAFIAEDYKSSEEALLSVESQITDIIKYRMKAYIEFNKKNYDEAKKNLEMFTSQADKSRLQASDDGLMGLIMAGLNDSETDLIVKAENQKMIEAKIANAQAAKDQTLNWEEELMKLQGGFAKISDFKIVPEAEDTKLLLDKLKAKADDTDTMYSLAKLLETKNDWKNASIAWSLLTQILTTWEPGFYQKAYALQKNNDMKNAVKTYEKFNELFSKAKPENIEALKPMSAYSHYAVAYILQNTDSEKALLNVKKCLEITPDDANAKILLKQLETGK